MPLKMRIRRRSVGRLAGGPEPEAGDLGLRRVPGGVGRDGGEAVAAGGPRPAAQFAAEDAGEARAGRAHHRADAAPRGALPPRVDLARLHDALAAADAPG